ncbi:nitrogen fixation protein NifQ [Zavarzinia compransoris]|uniref:nitrogen fixation protein NifQ n=1 Tax=Zavarzinia marina TaxID=2911065 RepID=UPI001F294B09|nr:nitrogen fixation protein NifQ [Zavarzinia marina]MCF4164813.1 nitrogen fixation protein NifQ [Zavarzinia marina]
MQAPDLYDWLMKSGERTACDAFDAHVVASILSLAITEALADGISPSERIGLGTERLLDLVDHVFPAARPLFDRLPLAEVAPPDDEACLRDLLYRFSSDASAMDAALATMMARRAQRPNHLWQDLGLRNRRELSWLMERHFEPLARKNAQDMKWKKFLYRMICRDDGYRLCTAPSCSECDDFEVCFGSEDGESLMARSRREMERSAAVL